MRRFTHLNLSAPRRRQFMITVPDAMWSQVDRLGTQLGRAPAEVVQTALDLLQLARDASLRGHVLAVATPDGTILKQIVIRS
jgi:hypothetical protein